ncbi:MAG: preprotein translocase subunit SecG [Myxococcales bacterium]|nr:preprotein translocase subunit SecG [Myxococcales bacterium]MDH3485170.1 preprotein translocase subunit SecG [Myxococcales bacterium]
MYTFVSILYIFVCLFLILVVLLQSGKGGGLGSAFGGGTSQQIFGGAGAGNLLTRLTAAFAFTFMALSVWLAFLSSSGDQALERAVREQAAAQEAAEEAEPTDEPEAAPEEVQVEVEETEAEATTPESE